MKFRNRSVRRNWERQRGGAIEPYMAAIFDYAYRLAELLEERIEKLSRPLSELALDATYDADFPEPEVITIYQHSWAIFMLSEVWHWGGQLREWHNHRWSILKLPFFRKDGLVWPCQVQRLQGYATIVGTYHELSRLPIEELTRVVDKARTAPGKDDARDYLTKASLCPSCGVKLNSTTRLFGDRGHAGPGDFSVCADCGEYLRFNPDMSVRLAQPDEVASQLPPESQQALELVSRAIRQKKP